MADIKKSIPLQTDKQDRINKKEFGKKICILRKKLNLSQAELAKKLNVSTQAISKWETGLSLPDIELLLELSWFFGISVHNLLEEKSFPDFDSSEHQLPNCIENLSLSKDEKKLVTSLIPYFNLIKEVPLFKRKER